MLLLMDVIMINGLWTFCDFGQDEGEALMLPVWHGLLRQKAICRFSKSFLAVDVNAPVYPVFYFILLNTG